MSKAGRVLMTIGVSIFMSVVGLAACILAIDDVKFYKMQKAYMEERTRKRRYTDLTHIGRDEQDDQIDQIDPDGQIEDDFVELVNIAKRIDDSEPHSETHQETNPETK